MTTEDRGKLSVKVALAASTHYVPDLALGYLRYEALRKLNSFQMMTLRVRNLHGENFDEMIDEIILGATVLGERPKAVQ